MIQHTGSLMSAIILPVFPEIRDVPCSRVLYSIRYFLYFTNEELYP